jgi:phospholipid/cholesterol/gamma-HCH transport system substrate-binding protein
MIQDARQRLTDGVNAARLKLEVRRALPSLPVILLGAAATLGGAALLFSQLTPTLFKSTREVRVQISDAYGILEGVDDVRYRGVPAGTIEKFERDGTQLVLKVSVRKDFPLYNDAHAELRPDTPLNDMYLDFVDPGSPKAGTLEPARPLPESRVDTSVKINDVLNTLRSNERTRLSQLLDNLGNGLADRGVALRTALDAFAPFIQKAGVITGELAARQRLTRRLVHNAAVLTTDLGSRERLVRTLVREGSATLGALQDGSADLDATLAELPGTVREANASLAAVQGTLDDVDGAVDGLVPVADEVPGALSDLRRLNAALRPAVGALDRPVRLLAPFATRLKPVAADAAVSAAALQDRLRSIDKVTDSVAKCMTPIQQFFQWNASLSKFGDANAPIPRGNLALGVPDTGVSPNTRAPAQQCAGGHTIAGRLPRAEDEG